MALLSSSDAIGKGTAPNGVTTDQRGFPLAATPDIGAFQHQPGLVVNTTTDGAGSPLGDLSLRQAIALANVATTAQTITFSPTVVATAQTITLSQGELDLTNAAAATTINGSGAALLSISGNGASGVFQVEPGVTAFLTGMTITGGNAQYSGGGVRDDGGNVTLTDCTITGNAASGGGGGVACIQNNGEGELALIGCAITNTTTSGYGGGVNNSATTTLQNCTISGNSAGSGGGGLYNFYTSPTLTLTACTVSGNSAGSGESAGCLTNMAHPR